MTNKAIHIIIAVILNLALTGVVVHKHYSCMGMDKVAVFEEAQSCCTDGCNECKDVTEAFRLDIDFLISQVPVFATAVIDLSFFAPASETFVTNTAPAHIFFPFNFLSGFLPDISPQAFLQTFRC